MSVQPEFGVVKLSFIPVRKNNNPNSQMVSQLLFGEIVEITDRLPGWYKIKTISDGFVGWIEINLLDKINLEEFPFVRIYIVDTPFLSIKNEENLELKIPAGSFIPVVTTDKVLNSFELFGERFSLSKPLELQLPNVNVEDFIAEKAVQFINVPFLEGGKTPLGFDNTNFIQLVYSILNVTLPRDLISLSQTGLKVNELPKSGDLAFFENLIGEIVHVGMFLNENQLIHVADKVIIEGLKDIKFNLNSIRRII